jgi:predicted porin
MRNWKTGLALVAVSAACVNAHAQSLQLVGLVDAFAGSMEMAGDAGRTAAVNSGGMTTSWWGFKGTEDLGGGLKANFALTSFMRVDTGMLGRFQNDPPFSRDASVGLSGGFGTLLLGRGLAPNFLPTVIFNPLGDSFTFSPLVLHANVPLFNGTNWAATTPADTGWSNEVIYTTPDFGGLTANLHYQFGEIADQSGKKNIGANLLYFHGPFAATAFYERAQVSNPVPALFANNDTKTDWMVGLSYDFTAVKVYGTYGEATSDAQGTDAKTLSLGATIPLGAGSIMLGSARTKVNPLDNSRTTTSVGYDYYLSKQTDVYAVAMHDSITSFNSGTSFGVGIRKRF